MGHITLLFSNSLLFSSSISVPRPLPLLLPLLLAPIARVLTDRL